MTRTVMALALALLVGLLLVGGASAHERRTVGSYQFLVGFLNEPPIVDEPNGVSLTVTQGQGSAATPVEGLANSLKVEVRSQGQSMTFDLTPVFGKAGAYQAVFIPTASGTYSFRIFGTLNGQPVDQTFTSGPNTFDDVNPRDALSFPFKTSSAATLDQTATAAHQTADTARWLALGGLVLGALGVIVGGAGLWSARRARAARIVSDASRETTVSS